MAAVKVVKHDYVEQKITFEAGPGVTKTAPLRSNRKHDDDIRAEMQGHGPHGDFKLDNVGMTEAEVRAAIKRRSGEKLGNRHRCDSCLLMNRNTGLPNGCEVKENKVCENCRRLYGRPVCSWTIGIPAQATPASSNPGNSFEALIRQRDTVNILRRKALNGLPGRMDKDAIMSAAPAIMEVAEGRDDEEIDDAELEAAECAAGVQYQVWGGP
jgi:hypothetical protein